MSFVVVPWLLFSRTAVDSRVGGWRAQWLALTPPAGRRAGACSSAAPAAGLAAGARRRRRARRIPVPCRSRGSLGSDAAPDVVPLAVRRCCTLGEVWANTRRCPSCCPTSSGFRRNFGQLAQLRRHDRGSSERRRARDIRQRCGRDRSRRADVRVPGGARRTETVHGVGTRLSRRRGSCPRRTRAAGPIPSCSGCSRSPGSSTSCTDPSRSRCRST